MTLPTKILVPALLLGLCGCLMQPDVAMKVTTGDGQELEVPMRDPNVPVTDGRVALEALQFAPWEVKDRVAKTLAFSFVLKFKPGDAPARIVVDDDTDTPILKIYENDGPKIVKDNLWAGVSQPFSPSDEHISWILNVDNNVRVYRVTVTLTDGTKHVLMKPIFIPGGMKLYMRKQLGLTS